MTKTAVIGMQFGDEAKAKMISYLLKKKNYDIVGRYGGGRNAGHTQIDDKGNEIITHLVPAGILMPDIYNILLTGVILDPHGIVEEIEDLRKKGYKVDSSNFGISSRVQMTLEYHKNFEREQEERKGKDAVGTTMKGIGPTAVSTYGREGLRFEEFLNPDSFERFLKSLSRKRGNIVPKRVHVKEYMEMYEDVVKFLEPFKVDEARVLEEGRRTNWLYEGAQGTLLDVWQGTIPYVTSSESSKSPQDTDETIGILKAYITRVGGGNLPTRMTPEEENVMRGVLNETPGAEFGATTGRPRNCGWFDAVASRFAASVGRIDKVALTKLDRLTGFPEIKVATAYRYRGSVTKSFPADRFVFEAVEPVYREFPGWAGDISGAREIGNLPQNARDYIKRIEDLTDRKISHVSVGQGAEQTIELI